MVTLYRLLLPLASGEKQRITGTYAIPFDQLPLLDGAGKKNPDLFPNQTLAVLKANLVRKLNLQGDEQQVLNAMETYAEMGREPQIQVQVKNIFGMLNENGFASRVKILGKYQSYCLYQELSEWEISEFEKVLVEERTITVAPYIMESRDYQGQFINPTSPHLRFGVTQKMFEVFKLEDQFQDQTLTELEQALQAKLAESIAAQELYMEEKNWQNLSNQYMLEKLIGVDGAKGYLHQHVVASRELKEREEKEIFLKNIFGAVLANWEERRTLLVEHHGDFLCRTATGTTLQQLAYEVYPEVISGNEHDVNAGRNKIDTGICLILQQRRDRMFSSITQSLAYLAVQNQDMMEESVAKERERLLEEAHNGGADGNGGFLGMARGYGLAGLQFGGFELGKQFVAGIGTSRHVNNFVGVVLAKNLGLSFYEEARRDVEIQLQRRFLDISVLDEMIKLINPLSDDFSRKMYLDGETMDPDGEPQSAMDELIEAIILRADHRLRFEDIRNYVYERFSDDDNVVLDAAAVEIPSDFLDLDKIDTAYETYQRQARAFLQKYLPQVLYDLSFVDQDQP